MKKFWAILLASAMLATMASCGANGDASESTNGGEANQGGSSKGAEIRFTWWGDTARHEVYNGVADRFEEANTGIKVVREANSWTDYWDKMATQVAGGNAPDVLGMHPQFASDYANRGALLDLQPYIDDKTIDVSKMSDAVVEGGKVNGLMCMISQGVTTNTLLANTQLLDEMGVTYPSPTEDWTYTEYATQAKKFADKAKADGKKAWFSNDWCAGGINNLGYYAKQQGEETYTKDGNLGFTEKTVSDWLTYWKDLRDYGALPDAAASTEDGATALEQKLFTLGRVALFSVPANQLHLYQQQMEGIDVLPLRQPVGDNGEQGVIIEGAHNAVFSKTKQPKEAAMFINFFTNTEESLELLKMEQGVPANSDMAEFVKPLLTEPQGKAIDFVTSYLEVATPYNYAPAGAGEIDTAYKDSAALVSFGESSPEDAAKEFMSLAEGVIEKNKK